MTVIYSPRIIPTRVSLSARISESEDGTTISDILNAYTTSVETRHLFERFMASHRYLRMNCSQNGLRAGFGIGAYPYDEDTFRPMFPVTLNGELEAYASIIKDIPPSRSKRDFYRCKIWVQDSSNARDFVESELHTSVGHAIDEDCYLLMLNGIEMRLIKEEQMIDCAPVILDR